MQQVSQFSVFGFNTLKQDIIDSDIFVMINYSILTGALICMQCDINIKKSQLEFIAHGIKISALILKSIIIVEISEVNISFRFKSNFSSAIVNSVNQTLTSFKIAQSIITGFNYLQSASNGYICSKMYVDVHVEIASLSVCIENMVMFGTSSFAATQTELETVQCANICQIQNYYITYGLCQQQPKFSTLLSNQTVICEHPFVFNDQNNICECDFGFYLNVSFCVNVIDQFTITQKNATILENELRTEIKITELQLKTAFIGLEQLIISNVTELVKNMNDNDLAINNNLISTNQSVHKNINDFQIAINNRFTTLDSSVSTANTKLDALKTQLTGSQTSIETKINGVSTQITNTKTQLTDVQTYMTNTVSTQQYLKDVYNSIMGTLSTQSYVRDVYNSLYSAVNAIAVAQDPCKQWPGSVNQGGLCLCQYMLVMGSVFCPQWNQCCWYESSTSYYHCPKGAYHTTNQCSGSRRYANGIE
ncbi:Hypothetical_protein [Hexamita inflata]|uniref:Hypothetical_protein n=1 Tax=Hexamita inflata TaxID=28002 RepID=A0AA86P7A0_9EUKA|nr:Hypothetical protein HINF_LOCUS19434 [Hexamita inflata]